jgi:hypothetical protein
VYRTFHSIFFELGVTDGTFIIVYRITTLQNEISWSEAQKKIKTAIPLTVPGCGHQVDLELWFVPFILFLDSKNRYLEYCHRLPGRLTLN